METLTESLYIYTYVFVYTTFLSTYRLFANKILTVNDEFQAN